MSQQGPTTSLNSPSSLHSVERCEPTRAKHHANITQPLYTFNVLIVTCYSSENINTLIPTMTSSGHWCIYLVSDCICFKFIASLLLFCQVQIKTVCVPFFFFLIEQRIGWWSYFVLFPINKFLYIFINAADFFYIKLFKRISLSVKGCQMLQYWPLDIV